MLNAGIAAAKGGDSAEARLLLRKAAEMKPTDPLLWLWLSATTQEPAGCFERYRLTAVALPARFKLRGFRILSPIID